MKVTTQPGAAGQVVLEVEVPNEKVAQSYERAFQKLAQKVKVPGFRPGKAPRSLLERAVGAEALQDEVVKFLVPDSYEEAVQISSIEPVDTPEIEIVQFEKDKPLIFKASVSVKPEVKLGDYKNHGLTLSEVEVTDEEVSQALDELRERQASLVVVDGREARAGDFLIIDMEGFSDGVPLLGSKSEDVPLVLGDGKFVPGFEDNLVGLETGKEKDFLVTFPQDYHDVKLAGQLVSFHVKLKEIKEKVVPNLDDEFASTLGQYKSLDELKNEIRKSLNLQKEIEAKAKFAEGVVNYAVNNATVEIPQVMIDEEIKFRISDLKDRISQRGITYENYLKYTKKTEDELEEEMRPIAEKEVKTRLVLEVIANKENIRVSDEELEAEAKRIAGSGEGSEQIKSMLMGTSRGLAYLRNKIMARKTIQLLIGEEEKDEEKELKPQEGK